MSINAQVVNAGEKYLFGLNMAWATTTTLTVAAGAARSDDNIIDIEVSASLTLNSALRGAGGLDTGTLANSTIYAVYVIADSYKHNSPVLMMSASATSPTMPSGYDSKRRIGFVRTNGSAQFLVFWQTGNGKDRWMHYDDSIATDITNGSSATFVDVTCTGSVPLIKTLIQIAATFTPTGADDPLALRPNGSSSTNGVSIISGSAAGVVKIDSMICPCNGDGLLEYKVTGSAVALNVQGYLDVL